VKRFFTVVGLLVLAWVVFTVAVPIIAWNRVATVNDVPDGDRPGDQPGTTILLVGSDSRQGMSEEERDELGTGDAGGQRADTMMIYYIPPSGAPALISLPRDSFVAIPGNGENKLNAAYAFGGPQLLVHTVEQATGLRIDGYLEIGFAGFANLVDAVGGVEVCLDEAIQDTDSHLDLPAGCQTLDGVNALAYVRMRKADPTGDIGRIARQREILSKVAQQAMSPATILNPIRWQKTCFAIAGVVTHGEDTGLGTMGKIALSADNFVKGDVISMVVPISNPGATTSAGSSVLWDDARAQDMFSQIASGDTSQLDQFVD
jgi:LCP family protein required for cell wall assembly